MTLLRKILVISRTPAHFADLADALAKREVVVQLGEGLFQGLALALSEPRDAVLIDLEGLRDRDLELIKTVRQFRPEMGVIAVAHPGLRQTAADALSLGADLYLLKPVPAEELLTALERVEMRRELVRLRERQSECAEPLARMALGVAHEVNNPLTTISGWLQMLADDRASDLQLSGVLRSMKEEADRIAEVVRQLLTYAQQRPPRREPVALNELVAEAVKLRGFSSGHHETRIDVALPDALPGVLGDADQLRDAFRILIGQAEAVMNGNGCIQVAARPCGNGVELTFRDNGPAIPAEELPKAFDPFHAGRSGNGDGVGLARAYGIVRSHGGRLSAASAEGAGTCFAVWLPADT